MIRSVDNDFGTSQNSHAWAKPRDFVTPRILIALAAAIK